MNFYFVQVKEIVPSFGDDPICVVSPDAGAYRTEERGRENVYRTEERGRQNAYRTEERGRENAYRTEKRGRENANASGASQKDS